MGNTVQLRIDSKTKRAVSNIFHSLGLDLSSGVKMYFQQVLKYKGIPFLLLTKNSPLKNKNQFSLASAEERDRERSGLRVKVH